MATIISNPKGFKVIEISQVELVNRLAEYGAVGVCDSCNTMSSSGYYIAVLNRWFCPDCYNEWSERAKWYAEDSVIEEQNFKQYKELFDLNDVE